MLFKKNDTSKSARNAKFDIKVDEKEILDAKGFIPAFCRTIAAIANYDGLVTVEEYSTLVEIANNVAAASGNAVVVNSIVINAIQNEISLDAAVKQLHKESAEIDQSVLEDLYRICMPLLACQHLDADKIDEKLKKALRLNTEKLTETLMKSIPDIKEGLSLIKRTKANENNWEVVKHFAKVFDQQKLLKSINEHMDGNEGIEAVKAQLAKSQKVVVKDLKKSLKVNDSEDSSVAQLDTLMDTLISQIQNRLKFIDERLEMQKDFFKADIEAFVENSVDAVELDMTNRMDDADWTNPEVWEDFSERQVAHRFNKKYQEVVEKYRRINDLWNDELSNFADEIVKNRDALIAILNTHDFAKLTPPLSGRVKALAFVDQTTDLVFDLTSMGGVAVGIAVLTKAVSFGAVAGFMVTNPVGWTIAGTVGAAAAYKYFSNPKRRLQKEIREKREAIRKGLFEMLGDPITEHNKSIEEFQTKFAEVAYENFRPMTVSVKLTKYLQSAQKDVLTKTTERSIKAIEALNV